MSAGAATVLLRGDGVAVATAARLLQSDGFELAGAEVCIRAPGPASSKPVVMLSQTALALLRDLFVRPELFAAQAPIVRRIVAWGEAEPITVPHDAIVVSGAELAAALPLPPLRAPGSDTFFTLHGAPSFSAPVLRAFGRRAGEAAAVELAPCADAQACYVEATESGWLFLIPWREGRAWLLGVGDTLDQLLRQSRLVATQIDALGPVTACFETAPRMRERLAGDDWLACGTAAIAFDPLCGDGTAQAAREGILATAVIAALRDGVGDSAELLGHYQSMLIAAMRRHLQVSLPFYRSGGGSAWWREQAAAVEDGYAWCTARLATMPEPRFLLRGARLVRRELAA